MTPESDTLTLTPGNKGVLELGDEQYGVFLFTAGQLGELIGRCNDVSSPGRVLSMYMVPVSAER